MRKLSSADARRLLLLTTARVDGSFGPGIDPACEGMSDRAYSDLAPVAYAVIVHKTFGWKLPHEEKTLPSSRARRAENSTLKKT
jgi:hypothetical protein